MHRSLLFAWMTALSLLLTSAAAIAQVFDEVYEHWPEKPKIAGTIVVGTALSAETIEKLYPDTDAGQKVVLLHDENAEPLMSDLAPREDFTKAAIDSTFAERVQKAQVLFLLRVEDNTLKAEMAESLQGVVNRGGTIICDGTPAAIAMLGALTPSGERGFGLLPDCVVAGGYESSPKSRGELLSVLAKHPRKVGIGITPGTALVLSRRLLRVVGPGTATTLLMANQRQPIRLQKIAAQNSRRQAPEHYLVDLMEWRRDAIDRTLPPFPPIAPRAPGIDNGSLVIVGGGRLPEGLMEQFIELAGGAERAHLVFIPCEERDTVQGTFRTVKDWEQSGVKRATFLHTKDRHKANSDEAFLAPLKDATGIWFGGGRQWNFADSYYGTKVHKLMKEVLKRGGVIGGSSAGASIQARYLARATPIGNFRIMAPGYERGGLGFISGVAIDQHFTQRGRQKDMTELMEHHPQLLGIGIDETTALIVNKSIANIVGAGRVYFYDRKQPVYPDKPDYVALGAGKRYNLATRTVVE